MKIIRWLCALLLLLLLSAACAAFAEGASVTLVLGDNTPTNGNKHYVKDGRTYSRDLTVPLVNGQQVIKASQTGSAVTYLCPVSPDAVFLDWGDPEAEIPLTCTIDELMGIFEMNCKKYDYEAEEDVLSQIRAMIVQRKLGSLENFANAREVRNLFEEIITNQARRVAAMESPSHEDMKKILIEDLVETAEEDAEKTARKTAGTETEGNGPESGEAEEPADTEEITEPAEITEPVQKAETQEKAET